MSENSSTVHTLSGSPTARPNPWLAAALSFLLPGAGQAFNGKFWQGVLLLLLSFVIMPAESYSLVHLGGTVSLVLAPILLAPWIYSMVDAARSAIRLDRAAAVLDSKRGVIYVSILLVVIFPIVALVFSTVTLLLLPEDVLRRIADMTEAAKRACGLRR
jgi:hypothetical protein